MPTLTISLSGEEIRHLESLSEREGLTVEQMVRLCIRDLITRPNESFRITAKLAIEKNAELYRRLS